MIHIIKLKWQGLGEKKYTEHMSKYYFTPNWENFYACSTLYAGFGAENNLLEGYNFAGELTFQGCLY